jgi:hypothetical protein
MNAFTRTPKAFQLASDWIAAAHRRVGFAELEEYRLVQARMDLGNINSDGFHFTVSRVSVCLCLCLSVCLCVCVCVCV